MINAENVVVAGGNFLMNINDPQTSIQIILRTFGDKYVQSATHDNDDILDAPKCHPGTRTSFLTRLANWVEDRKSSVYLTWLHGPAGAGKSAIARTLAQSLHRSGSLAGSFFFFRTDWRRNSEKSFVPTLAYQICRSIPQMQPYLTTVFENEPTVCSSSLGTQFEKLIVEPLVQITANTSQFVRPMLAIIDGLDECHDRDARNLILRLVFDTLPRLHGNLRFLVLSRPEYDIKRSFDSCAAITRRYINTIELQGDLKAYEDVRNYLRDSFRRIKLNHPLREYFPPDWPSRNAIEQLVDKSSGHFIYASTVVKYIENDCDQPQERLKTIINLRMTSQKPYAALDGLYLNILTSSRADHSLLVTILSLVVLDVRTSNIVHLDRDTMKSVSFIESLLALQPGGVKIALLDLISLAGVGRTIEFWHKSFSDFLLDSLRSNEFHADSGRTCVAIAKGCLRLLSDKTGLLERSWSPFTRDNTTEVCHHLLGLCCKMAVVDHDLRTAMMKYEFNVIPHDPHPDRFAHYFALFCSCLRNHQQAFIFKGTGVVGHLQHQFDHYFISELRHFIPLDSHTMNALRATISPFQIDWKAYKKFADENPSQFFKRRSGFLCYMYSQEIHEGEAILCEFFHSKERALEYFLGKFSTGPSISSTPSPTYNTDPPTSLSSTVSIKGGIKWDTETNADLKRRPKLAGDLSTTVAMARQSKTFNNPIPATRNSRNEDRRNQTKPPEMNTDESHPTPGPPLPSRSQMLGIQNNTSFGRGQGLSFLLIATLAGLFAFALVAIFISMATLPSRICNRRIY